MSMAVRRGKVVTPRRTAFIERAKLAYGRVLAGQDGGGLPYEQFKEYLEWRKWWYDNAYDPHISSEPRNRPASLQVVVHHAPAVSKP